MGRPDELARRSEREIADMHKTIITTAAALLSLATSAVQAESGTGGIYANELDRCVAALRGQLTDAQTAQLRYTVTDIYKRGAWYEFDIRSEVFNEVDGPVVRSEELRCLAHRWADKTRLQTPD
jgi:hypothetical protein